MHCTGNHRHIRWCTFDRYTKTSTGIALEKPAAKEATRVVVVAPADLVGSECRSSALVLALVGTFEAFPGHSMRYAPGRSGDHSTCLFPRTGTVLQEGKRLYLRGIRSSQSHVGLRHNKSRRSTIDSQPSRMSRSAIGIRPVGAVVEVEARQVARAAQVALEDPTDAAEMKVDLVAAMAVSNCRLHPDDRSARTC